MYIRDEGKSNLQHPLYILKRLVSISLGRRVFLFLGENPLDAFSSRRGPTPHRLVVPIIRNTELYPLCAKLLDSRISADLSCLLWKQVMSHRSQCNWALKSNWNRCPISDTDQAASESATRFKGQGSELAKVSHN